MSAIKTIEKKKNEASYKRLSLAKKVAIIQAHENGAKNKDLATLYNVVHGTITNICRKKKKYLADYAKVQTLDGNLDATTIICLDTVFEKSIYHWFLQKRHLGEPISGPLLREQALYFYKKIIGKDDFKASDGWLSRFKERHGIRCLSITGERLSANNEDSDKFRQWFLKYLTENDFKYDNIYNADETALVWKSLPKHTTEKETSTPNRKLNKDRITVLTCVNATGTHRIPLLMIGNSANPICFQNKYYMPFNYDWQRNALMDQQVFQNWFKNVFLVEVKKRKPGANERFILLLDNCPAHPPLEELNAVDPQCTVVYFPLNVAPVVQPMDQGCNAILKRRYKKAFLRELLAKEASDMATLFALIKSWSLYDCSILLSDCWESFSEDILRKCWKLLITTDSADNVENCVTSQKSNLVSLIKKFPENQHFTPESVNEWLHEDLNLPTFNVLNDDEIVSKFTDNPNEDEIPNLDLTNDDVKHSPDSPDEVNCIDYNYLLKSIQHICDYSKSDPSMTVIECQLLEKIKKKILNKVIYR